MEFVKLKALAYTLANSEGSLLASGARRPVRVCRQAKLARLAGPTVKRA